MKGSKMSVAIEQVVSPNNQTDKAPAPVSITQAAARQVRFLMSKKGGENLSLRIGVKGGGCSGLSYVMNIEESPSLKDKVFEIEGLSVFIDAKSLQFIDGLELDYTTKNLLEGGWKFSNPNAQRSCGCGTSFTPK